MCFPFDGLQCLPPYVNNLSREIPFSHKDNEGEQKEILPGLFTRFCRFSKRLSAESLQSQHKGKFG